MTPTDHKTILLVEDSAELRTLVVRTLRKDGYHVLVAKDGHEAFQHILETSGPVDILLSDIMLPGINGMDLARVVERHRPETKIILYSAQVETLEDQSDGLSRRVRFIKKPFTPETLRQAVAEVAGFSTEEAPAPHDSLAASRTPEILVVDDEPVICRLLKEFLSRQNFAARFAASGGEGLAALQRRLPDLMILDIYMPGMNGVELLRVVHRHWPTGLPFGVIILTGSRDEPLLQEALGLGAFDVVLKPVSLEYLDLAIWTQLAVQPAQMSDKPAPSPLPTPEPE